MSRIKWEGWVLYDRKQRKIRSSVAYFKSRKPDGYKTIQDWFFFVHGPRRPLEFYRLSQKLRKKWLAKHRAAFGKRYCIKAAKVVTLGETLEFDSGSHARRGE